MDPWLSFLVGIGAGMIMLGLIDTAAKHYCPHGCQIVFERGTQDSPLPAPGDAP
jgi:hypothetical protein